MSFKKRMKLQHACGGECGICDNSCIEYFEKQKAYYTKPCACGMATQLLCENKCVGEAVARDKKFSPPLPVNYYKLPEWFGFITNGWLEISNRMIDFKKKLLENQLQIDYSEMPKDFEELFIEHQNWAIKKFPDSDWTSSLRGLEREIKEVEEAGNKPYTKEGQVEFITEYVDCAMYLLDSINRAGVTLEQFKTAFEAKLKVNQQRDWKPNADGTYSHIKN